MARDASNRSAPTRREYVKYGGAVLTGGLFAGCSDDGGARRLQTHGSPSREHQRLVGM